MDSEDIYINAPWGKIACATWGQPTNQPVLMVHGYMDSAATFIYIVKHLPDTNYYVAIDMPGHGKSDSFPMGPLVNHSTLVEAMRRVIDHLKWERFILVTHSVGFITGVFYNNLYPFRISKMINIDPVPPLSTYNFHQWNPMLWYHYVYDDYYDNFPRWNLEKTKKFTYNQAINLLVKSRKFTKEQSAVVLSRVLVPAGDGMYRLSWEPSAKKLTGLPITEEMLITIVTENAPPMLNIVASEDETLPFFKKKGISWGRCKDPPILMLHGYMDSAATFFPLLKHLPKTYYYVSLDLPGHGKSSPLPLGPLINHSCYIETLHRVIEHLKWDNFVLISHSVAFIVGNLYNNLYPFKITKMINLEPTFPIALYSANEPAVWFKLMYDVYYENFSWWTSRKNKKYTYDQVINLITESRHLNKEQAAIVLSRVLEPIGNGLYRLMWQPCMKVTAGLPISEEMLICIISNNPPPSFNIVAIKDEPFNFLEENKNNLLSHFKEKLPIFLIYEVAGSHDVHITSPEKIADKIIDFLNNDFKNNIVSKL